jgi:hypothetical protein
MPKKIFCIKSNQLGFRINKRIIWTKNFYKNYLDVIFQQMRLDEVFSYIENSLNTRKNAIESRNKC